MRVNRSSSRARAAFAGLAMVVAGVLGLQAAAAGTTSTFVVNTTTDTLDARVGDGLCLTGTGMCSLRAAIQEANAHSGADIVQVPAGTYALGIRPLNQNDITTGDLDITDSVAIQGAGAGATIVDAGVPLGGPSLGIPGLDRLFEVRADGGAVSFTGVTLSDGYAAEYGGAVMNDSTASVTIAESTLTGNVAGKTGGAVENHLGGAIHLRDSTVSRNFATEGGSAINNNRNGSVTVENSTVSLNSGAVVGLDETLAGAGAISNNAELDAVGSIVVRGSQLSGNHAGGGRSGAGISNDGAGSVTVDRTSFSGNDAAAHGGAIYNVGGDVTVTDSSFTENAGTDGGAIDGTGTTTVSRSTFSSNSASANGGAISSGGNGALTVLDSTFSKNRAEDWGGAVHNSDKGSVAIADSAFVENAGLTGGGFGNEGSGLVTVENSTFTKNVAFATAVLTEGEGGGMHSNSGGEVVIDGSGFTDNDALSGGGLGNEGGGQLTVTRTRFASNHADEQGGGVLIQSGAVRMVDIDVIGNSADASEEGGGGIAYAGDKAVSLGETAAIEDSRIRDNKAVGEGGGIDSRGDGPLVITTTSITGNTAAIGGAIHHVGDASLDVTRSTLSGNFAESGGGVFADGDGEALIENTTISGNRAGQFGGGVLISSRVTVRSSTVAENSAASGGGISNGGGDLVGDGFVFVANTIVANSPTGGNCAGAVTSRGGNVDSADSCRFRETGDQPGTDPRLGVLAENGGATRTHALLAGSPAQENAVCTELDPCPPVDQRGVARPVFVRADVGAYESERSPDGGGGETCTGRTERPVPADFDSTVSQAAPGANLGSDATLDVQSTLGANRRSLVHFALPPVPPGCRLVGATLRMHASAATSGRSLQALRLVSAWSELGVTWSNQPATAGPAATSASGLGVREWDVLAQARDMYALGGSGFLIRDAVENVSGQQSFHSREKGENPPELLLVFDDPDSTPRPGSCPTTPQSLSADRDSWVSQSSASSNFGSDSSLKVKSQGGANSRVLLRFPLPPLPDGCTGVASAALRLEAGSGKEGRTLHALRLASSWTESGVTWATQPAPAGPPAATASAQGPLEWEVTDQLEDMYVAGNHGFLIRDRDENGSGDEQSLNSREKVADGPPELVLAFSDSTPDTTIDSGPPALTDAAEATFTFSSDRVDAAFECSLDGAAFAPCASPYETGPLAEGAHTLAVRATRKVRAVDPTPAEYDWTVAMPPDTTVDGPASPSARADATLTFASDDAAAVFECSLNGEPYAACSSPVGYTGLPDGAQEFRVRAGDRFGGVDPSPAVHRWTVAVAPVVVIDSGPSALANSASARFEFTGSDNGPGPLGFECGLDAGEWAACTSPHAVAGLGDGSHTFAVRATDAAGNVGTVVSWDWRIDTTAPETTIDSGPGDPTNDTSARFALIADEDAEFECRLDGGDWGSCSPLEGLADGAHVFEARAVDRAGNADPTPAVHEWTVDTAPPSVTIDVGPPALTRSTSATFEFGADEAADFECRRDDGPWQECVSPTAYTDLEDGAHTFDVRATDRAGNLGAAASYSWTVDTIAPIATITDGPPELTNSTAATLEFTADEPATFECRLDTGDWVSCESLQRYADLGSGSHTFEVRAADRAGNVGAAASYAWTIALAPEDVTAPGTMITEGPADPSNRASASFVFAGSDDTTPVSALGFRCRLDGGTWGDCTSPTTYANLGQGAHTFEVHAVDAAGNVDPTPATYAWTVDTVAPAATIDSAPSDPTSERTAGFEFSTDEAAAFECRLDGGAWGTCTSPQAYVDLAEGVHRFEVRATDRAGNLGAAASYAWTIEAPRDVTAPDTEIGDAPPATTTQTSARLTFEATEPGSSFECSLDGAPFEGCTSPREYSQLGVGEHEFRVRATDAAGNVDPSPASHRWTVQPPPDTTAPDTTITDRPADASDSASATFEFAADEPATFECRIDDGAAVACSSPVTYAELGDGAHTFEVQAVDAAGNADPSPARYAWTVDTAAPQATIDRAPADPTTERTAGFEFSAGEAASFECRLDASDWTACVSPHAYVDVAEGVHVFQVRATDRAGNLGAAASYTWMIELPRDVTAPDTEIGDAPPAMTTETSARFAFEATELGSSFECSLDGAPFEDCMSPREYSSLGVGEHEFRVRATDAAGNADESPASHRWTVQPPPDVTAPETTIIARPSDPSNNASATLAFAGSDDSTPASALGFRCRLDDAAAGDCTSPTTYADLGEGAHTFEVHAIDAAGNADPSPASYSWTVDTAAPATTVDRAPSDPTTERAAGFEFSTDEAATFECRLDGGTWVACVSPQAYVDLTEGVHTFEMRATDRAGNLGAPASYAWTIEAPRDVTAPETMITERPVDLSRSASATFAFAGSDDSTPASGLGFRCRIDEGAASECSSPVTYAELGEGAHTFEVQAVDAAGNVDPTPATYAWTVDTVAPATTVDRAPSDPTTERMASFDFSTDEAATFECRLDGGAWVVCVSPQAYVDLTEGVHRFEVRATDRAGNLGAAASYTWTIEPPPDVTAPDTEIGDAPAAMTTETSARFTFEATEPGSSFECSLDGAPFEDCTSPREYSSLSVGGHEFRVRATDAAGNVDPSPASHRWTVQPPPDTTAPDTTIVGGPDDPTNSTSASFEVSADELGATVECRLDGGAWAACGPYGDLTDGRHTLEARATDEAGNTDATPALYTWTVDTRAPETMIDSGPKDPSNSSSASFEVSADELGATVECRLDDGAWAGCGPYDELADGRHTVEARATDAAGNTDATPASYAWTVDTRAPETTIDSATTEGSNANFTFSADELGTRFECSLDGAAFAMCSSPREYTGLAVGEHVFRVQATDGAGNADASPATHRWTIEPPPDTIPPQTTIESGPPELSRSPSASFELSADEPATFECRLDGADWLACGPYTGLADGRHTVEARAIDRAGNVDPTPARHAWTIDTTAPETTIDSGPPPTTESTSARFTFSAAEPDATFECALDGATFVGCSSPREYAELAVGEHELRVRATDAAGNTDASPASRRWTIEAAPLPDTTPPQTIITAAPAATTTSTSASFSFSATEPHATFECSLDGTPFAACASPHEYAGLAVGVHEFMVRATDAAGNVDVTAAAHVWTVVAPAVCPAPVTALATSDAWIDQNSDTTNKGEDSILKVQSKHPLDNFRALVRFALPTVPAGCVLESATLRLYAASATTGRTLKALRLDEAWSERRVTWANQPRKAGGPAETASGYGYRAWSVTSQVEAMYSQANHGFLIRDAAENQDAEQQFHSREKGEQPPQLVLRFAPGTTAPFPAFTAFDAGVAGVSAFKAPATRAGRTMLPPSAFDAYGFACARACEGSTRGRLKAATRSAKPVRLPVVRFRAAAGGAVQVKVSLPSRGVRLVKQRRRARLALMTTISSGGSSVRLPAAIQIKARRSRR